MFQKVLIQQLIPRQAKAVTMHRSVRVGSVFRKLNDEKPLAKHNATSDPEIIIHVRDDIKGQTRDFSCAKSILLSNMAYFKAYLNDLQKVDISVLCDIHVFDWLMKFVKNPIAEPAFDLRSSLSILISADFLGMSHLTRLALDYIARNISDIIHQPLDLECVNESLLNKLANKFTDLEMELLIDPSDKMMSKLFRKKVEKFVRTDSLTCCSECALVYDGSAQNALICPKAPTIVDYRGAFQRQHSEKQSWHIINDYVAILKREYKLSWKSVYWTLWGACHVFRCLTCQMDYNGCMTSGCITHKDEPSKCDETYSCCGERIYRMNSVFPTILPTGCSTADHIPDTTHTDADTISKLIYVKRYARLFKNPVANVEPDFILKSGDLKHLLKPVEITEPATDSAKTKPSKTKLLNTKGTKSRKSLGKKSSRKYKKTSIHEDEEEDETDAELSRPMPQYHVSYPSNYSNNSWALERQRDEDAVCMRDLVDKLKSMRK